MSIHDRTLLQTCTHWSVTGSDGFNGHTYLPGRKMACRWQNKNESYQGSMGETQISSSVVAIAEDVVEGDFMIEGDYADAAVPHPGARRVGASLKSTDLRNLSTHRKVFLM